MPVPVPVPIPPAGEGKKKFGFARARSLVKGRQERLRQIYQKVLCRTDRTSAGQLYQTFFRQDPRNDDVTTFSSEIEQQKLQQRQIPVEKVLFLDPLSSKRARSLVRLPTDLKHDINHEPEQKQKHKHKQVHEDAKSSGNVSPQMRKTRREQYGRWFLHPSKYNRLLQTHPNLS